MLPVIYYRKSLTDKEELTAAELMGFPCIDLLTDIKADYFVIPRYSILPYAFDQMREITNIGATAINSYQQHSYVAELGAYVRDLEDLTPKTWRNLYDLPDDGTSFVLKGATNSIKQRFSTHMFAKTKHDASKVHSLLCDDTLISEQQIYIREYVPLVNYMIGIGGCPVSKEFRFFIAYGQVLCGAFYWQNYADDLPSIPSVDEVPQEFLQEVINRIGNNINFYVVDVAQKKADGDWMVVELNDGRTRSITQLPAYPMIQSHQGSTVASSMSITGISSRIG